MSQAFVREGENQDLEDVGPSLNALLVFLTRENGGIAVYEKGNSDDGEGNSVHLMSNGLSYSKGKSGSWKVV